MDMNIVRKVVRAALKEDIGSGDLTTENFVPESIEASGEFVACEQCIVAGMPVVQAVFEELNKQVKVVPIINDGQRAVANGVIAEIFGPARSILTGERVALNFLQRLSGVATLTASFVEKVKGYNVEIKNTRKTTPGLRHLERHAVAAGGGSNHRTGLYDGIILKDNHMKLLRGENLDEMVRRFRRSHPGLQVEIEAETIDEARAALKANADIIMLDNMSIDEMRCAVKHINGKAIVEASGGVTINNVAEIAATGVDWISIGALTSNVRAIDIKLEFEI